MHRSKWMLAVGMVVLTAAAAEAQVVSGVMSVSNSHMS